MRDEELSVNRETLRQLGATEMPVVGGLIRTWPPGECFGYTYDKNGGCPTATCTCTQTHD